MCKTSIALVSAAAAGLLFAVSSADARGPGPAHGMGNMSAGHPSTKAATGERRPPGTIKRNYRGKRNPSDQGRDR